MIIFSRVSQGLGLENEKFHLPLPLNHKGYNPVEFVYPLVLMLHSGE